MNKNPYAAVILSAAVTLGLLIAAAALLGGSQGVKKRLIAAAIPTDYFEPYAKLPPKLEKISGEVYAFSMGFNRGQVLNAPEGLAVFDTFNRKHAAALKAALDDRFPGRTVRWVVYSHNHLDHIRGADVFSGAEVIGHADVNRFVRDWPYAKDVLPVTREVEGDTTLDIGGVEVRFLYMQDSHSHTLYGFHLPAQNVVFAPDLMFVRAVPPFDFPDFYYPGYVRALDRLIALRAAYYVPSHMQMGGHKDLVEFRDMTVAFHETVRRKLAENDYEAADGAAMRAALRAAYDELYEDYGDWHGFDAMFVPKFGRHWGGVYLGY